MSSPSKIEQEEVVEEMMEELEEDFSKDFSIGSTDSSNTDNTGNTTPKPKRRAPRGNARKARTGIRRTNTPGGSEDYLSRGTEMSERLSKGKKTEEAKKEESNSLRVPNSLRVSNSLKGQQ